ncbi:hypothetical protein [Paenarthrobacter sp. 4246]|uniref:hypothetical protein n=1 Tax=Paenarthrobacter sp. 4246 TaxID=3156456 RepID=UPI0033927817
MIVVEPFGYVLRLVAAAGDGYGDAYSDYAREQMQMQMLTQWNSISSTYLNEMTHVRTNFEHALGTGFAGELPLLLFVVSDNTKTPEWLALHRRQASSVADGTVVQLPGGTTSITLMLRRSLMCFGSGLPPAQSRRAGWNESVPPDGGPGGTHQP